MKQGRNGPPSKPAVMGIFRDLEDLLSALKILMEITRAITVFAPSAHEEIQEALHQKSSPVRFYTLFGGLFGLLAGISLAVYTVLQWKFVVSGKPIIPFVPFVIVGFEFLILFGVLSSFAGLLIHSRLPRLRLPAYYDPRFSNDHFGILVSCQEGEKAKIAGLLKKAGAEEIHDLEK